jgi:hypothetical protein
VGQLRDMAQGHRCLMHRITVEGCALLDCYL